MNFDEVRQAIRFISHNKGYCDRSGAYAAVNALEREYAQRERRLREEVLSVLDKGFSYADTFPDPNTTRVYDDDDVELAHHNLVEILDADND